MSEEHSGAFIPKSLDVEFCPFGKGYLRSKFGGNVGGKKGRSNKNNISRASNMISKFFSLLKEEGVERLDERFFDEDNSELLQKYAEEIGSWQIKPSTRAFYSRVVMNFFEYCLEVSSLQTRERLAMCNKYMSFWKSKYRHWKTLQTRNRGRGNVEEVEEAEEEEEAEEAQNTARNAPTKSEPVEEEQVERKRKHASRKKRKLEEWEEEERGSAGHEEEEEVRKENSLAKKLSNKSALLKKPPKPPAASGKRDSLKNKEKTPRIFERAHNLPAQSPQFLMNEPSYFYNSAPPFNPFMGMPAMCIPINPMMMPFFNNYAHNMFPVQNMHGMYPNLIQAIPLHRNEEQVDYESWQELFLSCNISPDNAERYSELMEQENYLLSDWIHFTERDLSLFEPQDQPKLRAKIEKHLSKFQFH